MHRKRLLERLGTGGWMLAIVALFAANASAGLVVPSPQLTYPQVSGGVLGGVNYDFNASSGTGFFHMENVPYVLALGSSTSDKFTVNPTDDFQMQTLDVTLDKNGQIAPGANMYNLLGTLTAGGQTYSGILLNGFVTALGAQDLLALGISATTFYDARITITGGSLAKLFGASAYIYFHVDTGSTFTGSFDQHFQGDTPYGTIMPYVAVVPSPRVAFASFRQSDSITTPEPSTALLTLIGGAAALLWSVRRRHAK